MRTYKVVQRISAIYQYNYAKNGKGPKLVQRKMIPYRSNIESGHVERLNILEIFQYSYSAYRDCDHTGKVPQKHIFVVLFIHSINPTVEKSPKN